MRTEEVWLIGLLAVTAPLLIVSAVGWWRASRRVHWLERQVLPEARDEGTQHLERLVEDLANQVTELASSQDCLQRVLVNRPAASRLPAEPKATTPV